MYAESILIKDKKIFKVGKKDDLLKVASDDVELINLQGKTLIPAFIDAHSHFSGYASSFTQIDLSETTNFDEILEAIERFIKKNNLEPGQWIQGIGYDQNALAEKEHPSKELLYKVAPNNPVIIKHKSGHMGVVNTLGLKDLGIPLDTPDPEGGLYGKKNGEHTDILKKT